MVSIFLFYGSSHEVNHGKTILIKSVDQGVFGFQKASWRVRGQGQSARITNFESQCSLACTLTSVFYHEQCGLWVKPHARTGVCGDFETSSASVTYWMFSFDQTGEQNLSSPLTDVWVVVPPPALEAPSIGLLCIYLAVSLFFALGRWLFSKDRSMTRILKFLKSIEVLAWSFIMRFAEIWVDWKLIIQKPSDFGCQSSHVQLDDGHS